MSTIVDKERRIAALEKALIAACDYIDSAAAIIEAEIDPDDIDGENKEARRTAAHWRKLALGEVQS